MGELEIIKDGSDGDGEGRRTRQLSSQRNPLRIFFEAFEGTILKFKMEEAYVHVCPTY